MARVLKNALVLDGWNDIATGGGCNALAKELPNGQTWFMTDGDSQCPTRMRQRVALELLEEGAPAEGDHSHWCQNVAAALAIVEAYVVTPTARQAATVALREAKRHTYHDRYPVVSPDGTSILWVSVPADE